MTRVRGWALALWLLTVLLVAVSLSISIGRDVPSDLVTYSALPLSVATVGALIVSRHPRHRVGWIFVVFAIYLAVAEIAEGYGFLATDLGLAGGDYGTWVINWSWAGEVAVWAVVAAIFPDGSVPGRRWRWIPWTAAVSALLTASGVALGSETNQNYQSGSNPFLVEGPLPNLLLNGGSALLLISVLGGTGALVVRLHRSHGVEREQLKWFAGAASLVALSAPIVFVFWQRTPAVALLISFAFLGLPIAAGIAILRYRLYDIDLVIKRTLVYAALTAALVGTYLASVLVFRLILDPVTGESDLAVAASTLAVAALFRPLRARIQAAVDRKFYRRRYDATQTLEDFAGRLRHELDLETLGADLRTAVGDTMQPAHVTLWLRS